MSIKRINRGRGHSYKVDGKPVLGVTTILGKTVPKNLVNWAARQVAERVAYAGIDTIEAWQRLGEEQLIEALASIPTTTRNAAAARGTEVHKLAESYIKGEEVDVPEELLSYVENTAKFIDTWRLSTVAVEGVVASRIWRYGGTFDLVADMPDGRRAIFDYKTVGPTRRGLLRPFPENALQLAAYRWADVYLGHDGVELPMSELAITSSYVVQIRSDGWDVYPVRTDREVFQAFTTAVELAYALDAQDESPWIGDPDDEVPA